MDNRLPLTVTVDADDWAYVQRRMDYLQALLLRIVRQEAAIQEWFSAAELDALRLPGMPASRSAITRKANRENWGPRSCRDRGGVTLRYHVTALPPRAFDTLIARFLDLPPVSADLAGAFDLPAVPLPVRLPENTAPPWVLPLMRVMKGEAGGDLGRAWQVLPDYLPEGMDLPDVTEAANVLVTLGLA